MLQKYERKAQDILEKLGQEEPNERNFKMMSEALIVMAGGKIMEAIGGGEMGRYDGGRMDEYARGRGRYARRDGMGRYAYDGDMDSRIDKWDDRDDMYYDGDGRYYDGRSGSMGSRSGGRSGGMR